MPQSCGPALGARSWPGVTPQLRGDNVSRHSPELLDCNHRAVTEEAASLQGLPRSLPAAFSGQLGALPLPHGLNGGHGARSLFSFHPSPASLSKVAGGSGEADSGGFFLAPHAMVLSDSTTLGWHAMETPTTQGSAVPGEQNPVPPLPSRAQVGGLTPERDRLLALGLA